MRAAIGDGAIAVQVIPRRSLPGMNAADEPSKRLVQQRMRNRAIEALDTLAEGDDGVRAVGVVEYVEEFFDVIDDRAPWHWKEWSTFIPAEVTVSCRCRPSDRTERARLAIVAERSAGGRVDSVRGPGNPVCVFDRGCFQVILSDKFLDAVAAAGDVGAHEVDLGGDAPGMVFWPP